MVFGDRLCFLYDISVFLIGKKRRAWLTLTVCLILHFLCIIRFSAAANRANIVFSSIFFVAGGIIYLYRHELTQLRAVKWVAMITLIGSIVLYCFYSELPVVLLLVFSALTILGILDGKIGKMLFQNKIALFLGGLSMEVYLCHMFVYRCFERIKVTHLLANDIVNYSIICVGSILGAIAVALVFRYCCTFLKKYVAVREK